MPETTDSVTTRPPPPVPPRAPPAPPRAPIVRSGPRPFVVARGEDAVRVFAETLKHSGFFEALEGAQVKSGKRREVFEIALKVDFMLGVRVEPDPVSYVDPRLVAHLCNELLDRGFRLLRVVEVRGELSRYLVKRSVKEVGRALGYDESCYELRDLADDLVPIELPPPLGRKATGRVWRDADFRVVFAKNRTDALFGPALALYGVWRTLATPTDLVALEYGVDPGEFALASIGKLPVHFAIIDAIHSRDGSPGNVVPADLLQAPDGKSVAEIHRPGTVIAGADILAVEAAGQKMQGLDPLLDPWFLKRLRKNTGWRPPAEVDGLPAYPGFKGIGARLRDALGTEKPVESARVSLLSSITDADARLFGPLPSAWQQLRLRNKVEAFLDELRRKRGGSMAVADATPAS